MNKEIKSIKLKLLAGAFVILLVAQAFSGALSLESLNGLLTRSVISSFRVVAHDFLLEIQSAMRFGKPLDKFYGITKLMRQVKEDLPEVSNIIVAEPDGRIVHCLTGGYAGRTLSTYFGADFQTKGKFVGAGGGALLFEGPESKHLLFLVKGRTGNTLGRILFSFPNSIIEDQIVASLKNNAVALALATFAGAVALSIGLWLLTPVQGTVFEKPKLYSVLLLAIGGAQLAYAVYNVTEFQNEYLSMTRDRATQLTSMVRQDVEFLLRKNIRIDKLRKIENLLTPIIQASPEVAAMEIVSADGKVLNRVDKQGKITAGEQLWQGEKPEHSGTYAITLPLVVINKELAQITKGYVRLLLSKSYIRGQVREIMLDSLTVMLVSFLFLVELVILLLLYLGRDARGKSADDDKECVYLRIRPAGFVFVFAWALPLSFIPLFMNDMYEPLFGLSKNVILGLPISTEMFCALIAALLSGMLVDKRGWHIPFFLGLVLSVVGAYLCSSVSSALGFIAARGVVGFGYGLSWMAIQGYVFRHTDYKTRAQGITNLVAGIVSGQICGTAVGGMLAERMGYAPVFWVSLVLFALPFLFVLFFMRRQLHFEPELKETAEKVRVADLAKLLMDRSYFATLFLSLVPFALCQVGLLFYAAPLYLNKMGIGQSNIGRILMIYGLSVIYIAPLLSRLVDRAQNKKVFIVLGGLVGGGGLMSLYFYSGFIPVLVAVFLMGISGSLVGGAQSAYCLELDCVNKIGVGKAMSIQRAVDKLGQMLGPMAMGLVFAVMGIGQGVALIGFIFFVSTLCFYVFASNLKK